MLDVGDSAPVVSADNQNGETVTLDFSDPTVLYFYPKDDSPGCTVETRQFDAQLETYADAGVEVFGVSTDGVESHAKFCSKYGLDFALLADPDSDVADAFGVDTNDGTADRVTFVLADGEVKEVYTSVEPDGHAHTVLQDILNDDAVPAE